jgi:hypothetical protein
MRSVTALNWGERSLSTIPVETLQKWMKDINFLPNLDTVEYYGSSIWAELLVTGRIRRLSSPIADVKRALNRHPNKKSGSHLSMNGYDLQHYFNHAEPWISFVICITLGHCTSQPTFIPLESAGIRLLMKLTLYSSNALAVYSG